MDNAKKYESEHFKKPQKEYYPVNMWFWDDKITEDEISFQMEKFFQMGIYQIFIHPMWGMTVEYLSDEYFSLIKHVVAEAKKRGQKYWIYDEYNWPSGPAGGKLLRENPEARGKLMRIREVSVQPGYRSDLMIPGGIYKVKRVTDPAAGIFDDVTDKCEIYKIDASGGGTKTTADWNRLIIYNDAVNDYIYKIFYIENEKTVLVTDVWGGHSNYTEGYIDALNPEAVRAFIELTHEKYKLHIGDEFGKTVMGVFTDEPCITSISDYEASGIPWYDGLETDFLAWSGRSLSENLELLYMPGDTDAIKNAKIDFWRFLGLKFQKTFISAMAKWCEDNNLLLTGHMCGEEGLWSNLMQSVDIFRDLSEFHLPGIDSIFSKQSIDTQNFNIAGKIIGSAGRFYDKSRLLCETYTGSGWDLRFSDMRRIANRLILLGVNMIQYMGSYYTLDNMRKLLPICYPPSHSYNNPLMCGYKPFGEYTARLQYLSDITKPKGRVLVIMPTIASFALCRPTSVLMGYYDETYSIRHMDLSVETAVNALLFANVEYDLASDTLADSVSSYENGIFTFCGNEYDWLILPAMHYTDETMASAIRGYAGGGGKILFINGCPENMKDIFSISGCGFPTERLLDGSLGCELVKIDGFTEVYHLSASLKSPRGEIEKYIENAARDLMRDHIALSAVHGGGVLISQRAARGDESFDLSFIVNDTAEYKEISGVMPHEKCVFIDPETGGLREVKTENSKFCLTLDPYECVVLTSGDAALQSVGGHMGKPRGDIIGFAGKWSFTALEPNVLVTEKRVAKQNKNIETQSDPSKGILSPDGYSIPKEAGIASSDRFSVYGEFCISDLMPLKLMYESSFADNIYVNGEQINNSYDKKVWGIDNKEADISEHVKKGKNTIVLDCRMPDWNAPFKLPFFAVKGEFQLNEKGEIAALRKEINPAPWTNQGFRYYTGKGKYENSFVAEGGFGKICIDIPTLDPSEVQINGTVIPKRYWAPFTFDLTKYVKPGSNTLSVTFDTCYANLLEKPVESGMISEPVIYCAV